MIYMIFYPSSKKIQVYQKLKIYNKFKAKVENLKIFPELGTEVPELKKIGIYYIKQMVISPWKVYYKLDNSKIIILSIIDSRRNLEDILIEKLIKLK